MPNFNKECVNRYLLSIICCVFLMFLKVATSLSADALISDYYENPKRILAEASKRGSKMILAELYSDPAKWNFVLKQIATGTETWLRVAVTLHSGADAGASEMLTLSVGEALENAPSNVFKITLAEFGLESICSGPDVDDARYNSYELAIEAINQRQKRISTVTDPKLKETCNKCSKLLEESKAWIAKFYEKKG